MERKANVYGVSRQPFQTQLRCGLNWKKRGKFGASVLTSGACLTFRMNYVRPTIEGGRRLLKT